MHPRDHRGDCRREEEGLIAMSTAPGKRTVVEGDATGAQEARGLDETELAIGDGALGFWKAMRQVFGTDEGATLLGAQDGERAEQPAALGSNRRPEDLCV